MSSPYVYRPITPVRYTAQFQHTPYYAHTPRSGTPFIPDSALYPSSPYSRPGSLPGSPNRSGIPLPSPTTPNRYAFPSMGIDSDYATPWENYQRGRRPSWHGANDGQWLQSPPVAGFNRRHSFGASGYQPPPQFQGGMLSPNTLFTPFYINPWINAQSPRPDFFFDLALPSFTPLLLHRPGQSSYPPSEEMMQPATHPPVTRLRIICDALPDEWPIELQLDRYQIGYQPPPITLSDVLVAVHRDMHKQITHTDWAMLSEHQAVAISRSFTRRCRAIPTTFDQERAKGVKRVDYLLGKTRMVGVLRVGSADGWEVMKLIVE